MVYISKVYTKFGDDGQTMLANGDTADKDAARVRAYGDVDELNAALGLLRLEIAREPARAEHAAFLRALDEVDFSVCAHGRPVSIRVGPGELERRFHRS